MVISNGFYLENGKEEEEDEEEEEEEEDNDDEDEKLQQTLSGTKREHKLVLELQEHCRVCLCYIPCFLCKISLHFLSALSMYVKLQRSPIW